MFDNLKNNIIGAFLVGVLLVSSLAFLTHHSMTSNSPDSSSCKTTCFTESSSTLAIALPEKSNTLLLVVLPLLTLAIAYGVPKLLGKQSFSFLYDIGPPIYKRLAVYRI